MKLRNKSNTMGQIRCACPLHDLMDERFEPMTADEKQMQDMQANLKESGMSGTMYKREDLAGMMDKMGDMMPGLDGEEGEDVLMEGSDDVDESAEADAPKDEV